MLKSKKKIYGEILHLLIPIILENVLSLSATIITTAMVGRLLALDISAQGVANRLTSSYLSIFKGIGIGLTVLTAYQFGAGRKNECRRSFELSAVFSVLAGTLLAIAVALCPELFVKLFSDDPEILAHTSGYLRLLTVSLPFVAVNCFVTASFQGQGNTRTPMIVAGVVNAINIILGWLLIFGNLGAPKLGLIGAAIALNVAQIVGALLSLALIYSKRGPFTGIPRTWNLFTFDKPVLRDVYTVGLPAAGENMLWQVATIFISRILLSYGTEPFAAYQLANQAEGVCDMLSMGFITAAVTLAARAIGSRDGALLREYFKCMMVSITVMSVITAIPLAFAPEGMMRLLTDKEDLVAIGAKYLFAMTFAQFPQNCIKTFYGFIRAAGYKLTPLCVSVAGLWGVRVVFCAICGLVLHLDVEAIWWVFVVDQCVRATLSGIFFLRKKILTAADAPKAAA